MRVVPGGDTRVAIATALVESSGLVAPPEELLRQLAEYDPNYIDLIVDSAYWDRIGDPGKTDTTQERQTMIKASRRAWRSSPLDQWVKWTWTAEGLGQGVSLVSEDATAQAQWDEFWEADRNAALLSEARIHDLSFDLLNDGNLFLAFYASPVDGEATVRDIDPDEITDIIRSPSDKRQKWFYKREYLEAGSVAGSRTLYYPDWSIFFDGDELERAWTVALDRNLVPQNAERADLVQQDADLGDAATTRVCVLHIAHNCKVRGDPWGWPLSTVSMPYQRGHKQFIQATLSKVLAVSQFVRRSRVQGGSRAVNSVLDTVRSTLTSSNRLETNPPPVPGASWHVENQSVQTEELPLSTAAGDTDRDNKTLAWAALLGGGLFPATAGLDVARYATALTMDRVQAFIFSWYQRFWSSQFKIMFKIVLGYAGLSRETEVTVSIDTYGLPDFPEMVGPTTALMQSITQSVGAGVIGAADAREVFSALLRPVLQAIGASDISDLLDFEEPPEPPTPTPEPETETPDQDEVEEGGKGSGWFGPARGGTHGKGSQSGKGAFEKVSGVIVLKDPDRWDFVNARMWATTGIDAGRTPVVLPSSLDALPKTSSGNVRFFHGTSLRYVPDILKKGILPGRATGNKEALGEILGTTDGMSQFGDLSIVVDVPAAWVRNINSSWAQIETGRSIPKKHIVGLVLGKLPAVSSDRKRVDALMSAYKEWDRLYAGAEEEPTEEVLRLAAGHYERGEIDFEALLEAAIAVYTEGGKGSGWWGPDKGGTHGKGSQGGRDLRNTGYKGETEVVRSYRAMAAENDDFPQLPPVRVLGDPSAGGLADPEYALAVVGASCEALPDSVFTDLDSINFDIGDKYDYIQADKSGRWTMYGTGDITGFYDMKSYKVHINPARVQLTTTIHEIGHHVTNFERPFWGRTEQRDEKVWRFFENFQNEYEDGRWFDRSIESLGLRRYSLTNRQEFMADLFFLWAMGGDKEWAEMSSFAKENDVDLGVIFNAK